MAIPALPPESPFSREVFKLIRPHIPWERWPPDSAAARFVVAGDGLWLNAEFDDFPRAQARLAAELVRRAGVDLVLQSPAAAFAIPVARTKRWRDFCLYAFLPLLFAIPLMASLSDAAMRAAVLACGVDALVLAALQIGLARGRAAMAAAGFVARIPAPGRKLALTARVGTTAGGIPEV